MTTMVQARDAIVARLVAGWTHSTVPIYQENTTTNDPDHLPDIFGKCKISFHNGRAAGMGRTILRRMPGTIDLQFSTRETLGTKVMTGYLDELLAIFEFKSFGGVTTNAGNPGDLSVPPGWCGKRVRIPFYFDSSP